MKLVRDKLACQSWDLFPEGKTKLRPVADLVEHVGLLQSKILEEVGELLRALDQESTAEELGDILETLRAWAELHGVDWRDVKRARYEKWLAKGGFTEGWVWDV